MKFMISYTYRRDGLTFEQNVENSQALTRAFAKWKPEEGLKVHAFVSRVAGDGGFILAETNEAKTVYAFVAKYVSWTACRVDPVLDVAESVGISQDALAWAVASAAD